MTIYEFMQVVNTVFIFGFIMIKTIPVFFDALNYALDKMSNDKD